MRWHAGRVGPVEQGQGSISNPPLKNTVWGGGRSGLHATVQDTSNPLRHFQFLAQKKHRQMTVLSMFAINGAISLFYVYVGVHFNKALSQRSLAPWPRAFRLRNLMRLRPHSLIQLWSIGPLSLCVAAALDGQQVISCLKGFMPRHARLSFRAHPRSINILPNHRQGINNGRVTIL